MKQSILITGTLEVFAFVLVVVEARAAIPREYNRIIIPADRIEGWHRAGENYYKYERRLIIGQDHPYGRYSNTKVYWPDEKSSHATNGRIKFFKCINQTPNNARALMHLIRGGMGTPELVLDVMYTPIQFKLINTMVITCDVYTEESDIGRDEQPSLWDSYNVLETTTQITSDVGETKTVFTTARIPTTSSLEGIRFNEITSTVDTESTTKTEISSQTNPLGTDEKYGKPVKQSTKNDSLTHETLIKTNETSFHNEDTTERTGGTTEPSTETDSNTERQFKPVTESGEEMRNATEPSTRQSSKDYEDDGTKEISRGREETNLGTEETTTLKITSPKTIGSSPEESIVTNPTTDETTSNNEDESSEGETEVYLECRLKSVEKEKTSLNKNDTSVIKIIRDLKNPEVDNSTTKETIEKPTTSSVYNLPVKFVPMGSKRKIGLAKIMY